MLGMSHSFKYEQRESQYELALHLKSMQGNKRLIGMSVSLDSYCSQLLDCDIVFK